MTEHATAAAVIETPHDAHHDAHDGGHHNSPEEIAREKRRYLVVFGMLAVLTVVTVAVSKLNVSHVTALILALAIASVKGSLVAAYFMHLISERKLVISVLLLTAFFFGVLMWGPWHHVYETRENRSDPPPASASEHKPSGH